MTEPVEQQRMAAATRVRERRLLYTGVAMRG
jgi:hypothetical protein